MKKLLGPTACDPLHDVKAQLEDAVALQRRDECERFTAGQKTGQNNRFGIEGHSLGQCRVSRDTRHRDEHYKQHQQQNTIQLIHRLILLS